MFLNCGYLHPPITAQKSPKALGKDRQEKEPSHDATQGFQGIDWLQARWIALAVWATQSKQSSWNFCSKHGFSFLILASKSEFPFVVNGIWRLTCCWGFWPCRAKGIATTVASKHAWVGCVCATRHAKSTTDVKTLNFENKCCVKKCFPSYLHVPELFEFSGVFLVGGTRAWARSCVTWPSWAVLVSSSKRNRSVSVVRPEGPGAAPLRARRRLRKIMVIGMSAGRSGSKAMTSGASGAYASWGRRTGWMIAHMGATKIFRFKHICTCTCTHMRCTNLFHDINVLIRGLLGATTRRPMEQKCSEL